MGTLGKLGRWLAPAVAAVVITALGQSAWASTQATAHPASHPLGRGHHLHMFATPRPFVPAGLHGKHTRKMHVRGIPGDLPVYEIINANSHLCMEVYQSEKTDFANVDQYHCNLTKTQIWLPFVVGTFNSLQLLEFINQNSGKCADVFHSGTANGTNVDQYTCNNTAAQYFVLIQLSNGNYQFFNLNSFNTTNPQVIEVFHSSTANYGNVDTWGSNGSLTQQWFVQIPPA